MLPNEWRQWKFLGWAVEELYPGDGVVEGDAFDVTVTSCGDYKCVMFKRC